MIFQNRLNTKTILLKIALSLILFVLLCAVLEIAFNVFHPVPYYGVSEGLLQAKTDYSFGFTPNFRGEQNSIDFSTNISINHLGLNDYDNVTYSSNKRTILFLGDSMAEGYGLLKTNAIPKVLEKNLNESEYRVINAGIRGFSTKDELDYLTAEGYKFSPSYIFVLFSDNDITDNFNTVNIYRGFPCINTHISFLTKFKINSFLLLKKLSLVRFIYYELDYNKKSTDFSTHNNQIKNVLADKQYLNKFEKYAVLLNNKSNELNASLYFILVPWLKQYQLDKTYNTSSANFQIITEVRTIFDKKNIAYFDLTEDLINAQKNQELYFKYIDGHFNRNGANITGMAISKKFKKAVNHS